MNVNILLIKETMKKINITHKFGWNYIMMNEKIDCIEMNL